MDGSQSSSDRVDLFYRWEFVSIPGGANPVFSNSHSMNPIFTPEVEGEYIIGLVVSDGVEESGMDTVKITVIDYMEVDISAGSIIGEIDPPEDKDAYSFQVGDGDELVIDVLSNFFDSGLKIKLFNPNGSAVGEEIGEDDFQAVFSISLSGKYTLLIESVDSGMGNYEIDIYTNYKPIVQIGQDRIIALNTIVMVEDAQATDADGDTLSLKWSMVSRPSGSTAELMDVDSLIPSFMPDVEGIYQLSFYANDGVSDSLTKTISLTAYDMTPFPEGEAVSISNTIETSGDKDVLTFTGMAGDQINLYATHTLPSYSDLYVTVFDPAGSELISGHSYNDINIEKTLLSSGTYMVFIEAEGSAIGDYTLYLSIILI